MIRTWSSEPREGLGACRKKAVPSFLSYFKTLSITRAYSWEFLVGVCRPVFRIPTLFQTKKCVSPLFDLEVVTKRNIHVYIDIIITAIRTPTQKLSLIHETTNTLIHYPGAPDYRSSLVNHTRFQTKMYKIYTLCGGTYLCGLYKGVPPGEYWSGPGNLQYIIVIIIIIIIIIDTIATNKWLSSKLKGETEGLLVAAQDQAINTRNYHAENNMWPA